MAEDLVTLAQVQTRLGLDHESPIDTSQDALINQLIDGVSAAVEAYCRVTFAQASPPATITEYVDGGGKVLLLKQRPVLTLTSVSDRQDSPPSALTAPEYELDDEAGTIYRKINYSGHPSGATWESGRRRWEVIYTAGYLTCPADVQQAVLRWIESLMRSGDVQSEKLGDYAYTLKAQADAGSVTPPDDAALLLAPYVQKGRLYFK